MAETAAAPNNRSVSFGRKTEREMPVVSQAQNAAMHAAEEGKSTLGIPKKVGKEFVEASHGMKIKKLPQHIRKTARHAIKRGMISAKAAAKHLGGV